MIKLQNYIWKMTDSDIVIASHSRQIYSDQLHVLKQPQGI